jgi:hypothetical protein
VAEVDVCDNCGLPLDDGSHFSLGKTWCTRCFSGQRPPVAMPPNARQRAQIAAWLRPRTSTPPRQQTLRLGELAQPQGAIRG